MKAAKLFCVLGTILLFLEVDSAIGQSSVTLQFYPGLTITGAVGSVYIIQANTNLAQSSGWSDVEVVQLQTTNYLWFDKTSPANIQRFYRTLSITNVPANTVSIPAEPFSTSSQIIEVSRNTDGIQRIVEPSTANLVVDGSFENGPGGSITITVGNNALSGWTILSGSIDSLSLPFQSQHGTRSIDLDGYYKTGAVSQTINVHPGQNYLLSFWMAGNPDSDPGLKRMNVLWGGSSIGTFAFDTTGHTYSNMGWTHYSRVVRATHSQMTLVFLSLDAPGSAFGPCLDNVSLTVVPNRKD